VTVPDIVLVPHTHRDREWYEPFQRFRMRLVDVVDDVLVRAEADPDFRFTFDGQMAAVEDYLEVRPGNRDRFADLVRRGQFAIGPWRVLLDEFLCSGENIIRNLQHGQRQAAALGGSMGVGYLPDMFGHIAQMPQILRGAGLQHACVYRGVPSEIAGHAFRWVSPDGAEIRTEYLIAGYGNVSDLFDDPADLPGRLDRRRARWGEAFGADDVLAMYGTDHSGPLPTLMALARQLDSDLAGESAGRLRVATLQEYVTACHPADEDLPAVHGELRSHARANILPGVISVRPHLKQALAAAERMVERYAEPLQALWGTAWPATLLDLAWGKLIDCSCHDSVTGCGVDETAVQVAARIAEAGQIGQAVRDDVTAALASMVPSDAALVINPVPRPATMVVQLDLPAPDDGRVQLRTADGATVPVQELARNEPVLADERVDAADLAAVFRRVHDRELFGRQVREVRLDTAVTPPRLTFQLAADPGDTPWDVMTERARAARAAAQHPGPWQVRTVDESRCTVLARIDVPALGFTAARLVPAAPGEMTQDPSATNPASVARTAAAPDPMTGTTAVTGTSAVTGTTAVTATPAGLAGAGITVGVNADGTLRISSDGMVLDGVGRLLDGGDAGDSYNYAPPGADVLVDTPDAVDVRVLRPGPVVAAVLVRRRYSWPADSSATGRSARTVPVDVDMRVELRSGESFVRLEISFDNQVRDHRLRLHVPCLRPATVSHACGQFSVTERGLHPQAGPVGEFPIATYPASSFVDAGGVAVLLAGPTEYELLNDPDELAVTIMRGTGYLSRNRNAFRDEPAGPNLPTPLGQSPGSHTVRLAVLPHAGDWQDAPLARAAEDWALDPVVRAGSGAAGHPLPVPGRGLEVTGDGVQLSSAVAGPDGSVDVRLVALSDRATTAALAVPGRPFASARMIDLLGRPTPADDTAVGPVVDERGGCTVPMRPWQIRTVRLAWGAETTGDPASRAGGSPG
jgi:alpha-mannosidase